MASNNGDSTMEDATNNTTAPATTTAAEATATAMTGSATDANDNAIDNNAEGKDGDDVPMAEVVEESTEPGHPVSTVHLAGFADAIPSPSPKKKVRVAIGGVSVAVGGSTAAVENATPATKGEKKKEIFEIVDHGDIEGNEIVVTPAAGAIMDAISTSAMATATATPTEEKEEEEEEEDASKFIQEIVDNIAADKIIDKFVDDIGEDTTDDLDLDPIDKAARETAAALNQEALYSTYESNFTTLQKERDDLRRQLIAKDEASSKHHTETQKLQGELASTKTQLSQTNTEKESMRAILTTETNANLEMKDKVTHGQERVDRVEKEADSLRSEISRLVQSNAEYNTLLSSMSTQNSKSSSEAIPLRLQAKRLEQELQAVTSHSTYLEGEVASKMTLISGLKQTHSGEMRAMRMELDRAQLTLEQRERDMSSARMASEHISGEIDRLQTKLYNREMEHASQKEVLEQDLNKERELVALKEQRMLLAEDQRASLLREVEEMKGYAKEAAEEAAKQANEVQRWLTEGIDRAVEQVREEELKKRKELEEQLVVAQEAKLRIEEDILKSTPRRRRIEGGEAPLAITDGSSNSLMMLDDSSGPLSLTDLYTRLAETEDELRNANHENQKLKILIDRIHHDVASKTPIFHQKQLELESALEELDMANERLDYARREVTDMRADTTDLETNHRQLERECGEYKRENVDLATQVQSLLQRRSAESGDGIAFHDISSLQQQNQKLLREHHSMSAAISELENKIKSDSDVIELNSLRDEVGSLREEREKQSKLVVGIVHQRDLYRALVAKNDAPLIANEGQNDQLALADARAEQLPLIEAKNHNLTEEVSKLKAEVSCFKHENEALEGRLARVDAHANELTTSNERLRGDLTTAKSTVARLEIDVSHYQGRCERFETSLAMAKSENESEVRRKGQMEEILGQTQNHLEMVRGELAKKEQQYQQASSKMRLIEVQLETSTSNERRMESEASALRSEIARQETLLSSVQRIEASLTAKSEGELENLHEEVKRLQESKSDDSMKHTTAVQKLEGKIADLDQSAKELTAQKEAATVNAAKESLEGSNLKAKIEELSLKLKTTEKELTAAKVKLGDVTIDTSVEEVLEAKVTALTTELDSTKSDLATAQKRIVDYQNIAKAAEEQVAELTAVSTKYKDETTSTLEKLRTSEQSQKEAVAELTNDLMSHRDEKEKAVNELKAKIDSLTAQLGGSKEDASKAIANMESLTTEAKRYQLDAKNANVNYERELALHAEARSALRDARSGVESEQRLRETAESQLATRQGEIEVEQGAWKSSKAKLEESLQEAKTRLDDMRSQNNLLHDQMASLSSTVEKFQSEKTSQLVGNESSNDGGDNADGASSVGEKQLSDLRELLRFKQSECTMLEADLASAKRASERERTAAELAKRCLEEARSELKILGESGKDGNGGTRATEKAMDNLRTKLKGAEEQLVLIRESNTMLREESQKVRKKLSEVQSQFNVLKTSTAPQMEKMKSMEVERASLEAEKDSLLREVEAWKGRVHSLVSKFNQIDPEEHAQALASIEKLKGEYSSLKTLKEQADTNSANAKGLVSRLNKDISSQKSSIEAFKAALNKTKKENEELSKTAKSNNLANKKILEAQAATKKAEGEAKTSKADLNSLNARVVNFKKMMSKMQNGLKAAKVAEDKAKATEESLQKEITGLKQKLGAATTASAAASASADAAQVAIAATGEKPHAKKDGETEAVPTNTASDSSGKLSPTETAKPAPSTKSEVQPDANAEVAEKQPGAAATKIVAEKASVDTTIPANKKGKKRKANAPKKNAAPESMAESTKVPPQKKAAILSVLEKKETPPSTEAQQAAESTKVPPPKKIVTQSTIAKKISSTTAADPAVQSTKVPPQKKMATPSTSLKKDAPSTTAASKKEEEMKLKMALLKKRKAAALAKKQEAAKQLAAMKEQETESSSATEGSEKSLKGSDEAKADSKPKESATVVKSQLQTALAASLKQPLPPVPVRAESDKTKESTKGPTPPGDKKNAAFGSSAAHTALPLLASPMAFGVPKAAPAQSEPDCPKPSFFGASTSTPSASIFGGASSSASTFGGAAAAKASDTPGRGSGAFLSLTPPNPGATPGKFVFGKSANITLTAPSSSPMAAAANLLSFGQKAKFGTTFGGGFGGSTSTFGASPFGGGEASKKRPLSTPDENGEQPEAKQLRTEEGEITDEAAAESSTTKKDAAAKEAE